MRSTILHHIMWYITYSKHNKFILKCFCKALDTDKSKAIYVNTFCKVNIYWLFIF